ncbi:hypothetical protein EUTSA_v10010983mg [Eutrema salsugineum]|uniref:RING-type domain-containing protein n=1 Tax=Eutrema salsugineum TaxID=72664 RepID=V4LP88_EUTSA|nr:E3 ubiquitin-protein ligase RNF181 [Eutrema salsugineum]ESQ45589.1 hypothetical protein EUTSA_v10010983mg [Eutrema salsugineum]
MRAELYHDIDNDPEPEDAGKIRITVRILGEYDHNPTFTTLPTFVKDFINDDVGDVCESKEALEYFLMEAGINEDDISDALLKLIVYVDELTRPTSTEYSHNCALDVRLDLVPDYLDDVDDEESQSQIEQVAQVSFDEPSNTRFRPASKLVVKSLTRKIYNKKIKKEKNICMKISLEECTICLEEFTNGGRVVTLPCGHEFDDGCIVKWFETSHVCPLCRFELPCEDQGTSVRYEFIDLA